MYFNFIDLQTEFHMLETSILSQILILYYLQQAPIQFTMGSNAGAYSYSYQSKLQDGGSSAQSESADGSGRVTGYYSMSAADGRNRKVDYSADAAGFNAAIQTNELGTKSDSPANVQFYSTAPQQPAGPSATSYAQTSYQQPQQQQVYNLCFSNCN